MALNQPALTSRQAVPRVKRLLFMFARLKYAARHAETIMGAHESLSD